MPAEYGPQKFSEAIEFFRSKVNLPSERWADVWREQHNNAFMIAGAVKTDLLADMRTIVDRAIAEGKSLSWFQKEFKHLVKKHGWDHTGTAAWRANIIYDTNMRQSYNAGRYQQLQNFPVWRYAHGDSRYPRPHHLSKDGTILPKESPFWKVWFPQNGWGCKCKVFGETERSMRRRGYKLSKEPVIDTREWIDKKTGEVHHVPVGIDPGFDYSPGVKSQAETIRQTQASKPPLKQRLVERKIPDAYSTNKNVDIHGLNRVIGKLAETQPQLNQVADFISRYNMKTLFLKPTDMVRGSRKIYPLMQPISQYLGVPEQMAYRYWPVPSHMARRANGYTSRSWTHVVVKAKTGVNLDKVRNMSDLTGAVEAAILAQQQGMRQWSLSHIVRNYTDSGDHGGTIVTWLHEMGHQVQFQAMRMNIPSPGLDTAITQYSMQDTMEWHAEHFAAWALNRDMLALHYPAIAEYFDQLLEQLLP